MNRIIPLCVLLLSFQANSQSYTEISNTGLENKSLGSIATGDLNNDGYIDIVTTGLDESGELSTSVYINDADYTFTKIDVNLTPLYNATIALGDYNEDGFLDILLAGDGYDPLASLWKNNGDLTFTEVEAGLANVGGTNAEFGDIDNDGDIDILISGFIREENGSYSATVRLYSNEGNDTFEEFELAFTSRPRVGTLGDYDNDGDLDLLVGGSSLEIYPNSGNGSFSTPLDFGSFPDGQIKWFDYDNDGNLDFVASGRGFNTDDYFTRIYENVGIEENWFAVLENTDLTNPRRQKLDIRDYNSDGYLDLLVTGTLDFSTNTFVTKIYDNSGTAWNENSNLSIRQLGSGDGKWADIDNDGDLDLILTGEEVQGATVKKTILYRNDSNSNENSSNTIPTAPSELSAIWEEDIAILSWNAGADNETSTAELSYNLGLGLDTTASDIVFPASSADGRRFVHQLGNAQNNQEKNIKGLSDGIYYFKVQSIDGALTGSPFNISERFAVGLPDAPTDVQASSDSDGNIVLSWIDRSVNEFSFAVQQKSNLTSEYKEIGTVTKAEDGFTVSDLEDAIYSFKVKAVNPNGEAESSESNEVFVGIPQTPSNIDVSVGGNEVTITWTDNSVNENSFVIEQKSNLDPDYIEAATKPRDENSLTLEGVPNGIYSYRIKAVNPNGESDFFESELAAVGLPTAPSNLTSSINSDDDILLTWEDNAINEFSFVIEQRSNLNTDFVEIGSTSTDENSFAVSELVDAIYTFRVKAVNTNGDSPYAESGDIAFGIPEAPGAFSAILNDDRSISLSWEDLNNERSFKIEKSVNGVDFNQVVILEENIQEFTDSDLDPGTYTYRIQARNENGESEFTNANTSIEIVLSTRDPNVETLQIYPNPSVNQHIFIRDKVNTNAITDIKVQDLSGKELNLPIIKIDGYWRIDIRDLPPATYVMKVSKDKKILSKKIVVK